MQREKKSEGTLLTEQPIMRKHNANLTANARELRKSMTKEERHLWYDFLRNYPVRFYRQKVIGTYIADFYCAKAALIVELDGSQHFTQEGTEYDARRTQFLNGYLLGNRTVWVTSPANAVGFRLHSHVLHLGLQYRFVADHPNHLVDNARLIDGRRCFLLSHGIVHDRTTIHRPLL